MALSRSICFCPVPLALIGALVLVYLVGGGLDIFGVMGMLMLIGLSAKNAILYLDFVVERIGKMPFVQALTESARLRFRPIVMTTMTVLVISFPLILGKRRGVRVRARNGNRDAGRNPPFGRAHVLRGACGILPL